MSIVDNLIAFTFAATVLTLTPGLDTALISGTSTVEGRKQGMRAALGIAPTERRPQASWSLKGMLGNFLNPEVGIFYVSFLTQSSRSASRSWPGHLVWSASK